mgnify:CR=1 FL=1
MSITSCPKSHNLHVIASCQVRDEVKVELEMEADDDKVRLLADFQYTFRGFLCTNKLKAQSLEMYLSLFIFSLSL